MATSTRGGNVRDSGDIQRQLRQAVNAQAGFFSTLPSHCRLQSVELQFQSDDWHATARLEMAHGEWDWLDPRSEKRYSIADLQAAMWDPAALKQRSVKNLRHQRDQIKRELQELRRMLKQSPQFRSDVKRKLAAGEPLKQHPSWLASLRSRVAAGSDPVFHGSELVTFNHQPVEQLDVFIRGGFRVAGLAMRILTVHLGLKFNLGEQRDDKALYIRQLLYPPRRKQQRKRA